MSIHKILASGLEGKVAIVTGASGDIGKAVTEGLLINGAFVIGVYNRNKQAIEELVKKYSNEKVNEVQIDFLDDNYKRRIQENVKDTKQRKGRIDILVNAVGVWVVNPLLYETDEDFTAQWRINYEAPYYFSREVIRYMIGNRGNIINIASTCGIKGSGQQATYCATKAALISLTESLAEEFANFEIRVNAVSPGPTDTKAFRRYFPDDKDVDLRVKGIPLNRLCSPEDVANEVLFILCNEYKTGGNSILHGGRF